MTRPWKTHTDGSPVTLTVKVELRTDDMPFLLEALEQARRTAEPHHQRALYKVTDAIEAARSST